MKVLLKYYQNYIKRVDEIYSLKSLKGEGQNADAKSLFLRFVGAVYKKTTSLKVF